MGKTFGNHIRYDYIDQLKGFAMILVVMGHVIGFCAHRHDDILTYIICLIQMPLFFMLNGLVISIIPREGGGYLLKKFKQILVPFFLWGILMSLFHNTSYVVFLTDYFCLGYWYLLVLFAFFSLYYISSQINTAIVLHYFDKNIYRIIFTVLWYAFIYIVLRLLTRFLPETLKIYLHYSQIIEYYPFFFTGVIIKTNNIGDIMQKHSSFIISILLTGLILIFFIDNANPVNILFNIGIRIWLCLTIYLVFMISTNQEKTKNITKHPMKILKHIGQHTLAIYMIHYYLLRYIEIQPIFDYLYNDNNLIALLALILIASLTLCTLSIFIEKVLAMSEWLSIGLLGRTKPTKILVNG